jgi:hypothetical protein
VVLRRFWRRRSPLLNLPSDGRTGWFEGLREGRFCGWTWTPSDPGRTHEVVLSTASAAVTVRADRFRADLQTAGLSEGCYGFSAPVSDLPGYGQGVRCTWADLDLPLPGGPWTRPISPGSTFQRGQVRLYVDPQPAGDRRLSGYSFDANDPLRRVRLAAECGGVLVSTTVASLFRKDEGEETGDGFHGFVLLLPRPLRLIGGGVGVIDLDRDLRLARLGARSV